MTVKKYINTVHSKEKVLMQVFITEVIQDTKDKRNHFLI